MLRVESGLFFANGDAVRRQVLAREVGHVRDVLDLTAGDEPLIRMYASVHEAVDAVARR